MTLDWNDYIAVDENVAHGKACIKGTRLTVEFITGLLATGWKLKDIQKNYPKLREKDLQAVFAYIHECIKDGFMFENTGVK